MSVAVPERIALELVARLETIPTVSAVERPNRDGSSLTYQHLSVQVVQGESQRLDTIDCPGNPPAVGYSITFEIKCVCRDSAADNEALATNPNALAAEAVAAIVGASTTWYRISGLAVDSDIGNWTPFESSEGEFNGMTVTIAIKYRVSENDPYEVRS